MTGKSGLHRHSLCTKVYFERLVISALDWAIMIYGRYRCQVGREIFMRKKLMTITFMILFCIIAAGTALPADYGGTIYFDSKTVKPGESFTIGVMLQGNDVGLTSVRVPLRFDNNYLTCTGIDFTGSLNDASMEEYYSIVGDEIDIAYIPSVETPSPEITDASGLIATLHFTVAADAPSTMVFIDSLNEDNQFQQFSMTFHKWRRLEGTVQNGDIPIRLMFLPGIIQIDKTLAVEDEQDNMLPQAFALEQNRPNPFNPSTSISFSLPVSQYIRLEIFNLLGQSVAVLADGEFPAGSHELAWDGSSAPTGVYFYRLSSAAQTITRKMMLLK